MAAGGAGLDIGGDEKLVVGVGTDHGANVAAVQNRPRRLPGEAALDVNQRGAHWRVNSDARGRFGGGGVAQGRVVQQA